MTDFSWIEMASGADGGVVVDQQDWVGRCVERMSELCPTIDQDDATQMAQAMWSLARFRRRGPDAVAAFLLYNSGVRPGLIFARDSDPKARRAA